MPKPIDIDHWTIPPFSTLDGIEGLYADDERAIDLWSHYHANRVVTNLRIVRARIRAFEWQLSAVRGHGDPALLEAIGAQLAEARTELAELEAKRDALEQARVADWYAPREWHWE